MDSLDHQDNNFYQVPVVPGHIHYRSVLEVFKMCSPQKVMHSYALVHKCWLDASASQELWLTFLEDFQLVYNSSTHPKVAFLNALLQQQRRTVVTLTPEFIAVLNPKEMIWKINPLSRRCDSLDFAYVMLWNGSLLCCGGNGSESAVWTLAPDGQLTHDPDLITGRLNHGLVAYGKKAFVFGGWNSPKYVLQNEVIEDRSRSPLPTLRLPRIHFTPCIHRGRIYLCGGHNSSVEVFDPDSLSFGVLCGVTLPDRFGYCISTVYNGTLFMLTETMVTKWDFQSKTVSAKLKLYNSALSSPMNATQHKGTIYLCLSAYPYFAAIEIENGRTRPFPRIT